ncbi:MAG: NADH-quinone oxidoreductase subunit C [Gammaproteobacteria bacterium]
MAHSTENLAARLARRFPAISGSEAQGETTAVVERAGLLEVCRALRDEAEFRFEQLIDLCGVDYAGYGKSTHGEGGLTAEDVIEFPDYPEQHWSGPRYAVVYHLLSVALNQRLRVKTFLDDDMPRVNTVMDIWPVANWYEREAFDMFGIVFEGHPDLRRLLTDYGFIGHPMRKDFPLIGQVEMRYDPEKQRVVYQPVSIENRVLVPRVIRRDNRYVTPVAVNNNGNNAHGNS